MARLVITWSSPRHVDALAWARQELTPLVNLAAVAALTFVVVTGGLLIYRKQLQVPAETRKHVMALDARRSIEDMDELKRTVPILVGSILLFFAHQSLHLEPATVALTGATAMLLVTRQTLERALGGIE